MKPNLARLRFLCPETEPELIREHLTRLEDRYFDYFSEQQVAGHLRLLGRLSSEAPVQTLFQPGERDRL